MASRPFASVDVALEVGAEQTDFLRGPLEVGAVVLRASVVCILMPPLSASACDATGSD